MRRSKSVCFFFRKEVFLALLLLGSAKASTLSTVRARHKLACAVVTNATDWNKEDLHGDISPLEREICHAIGIATLGATATVEVVQAPAEAEALRALTAGQVDVVVGVTPGQSLAKNRNVVFGPPVFWDAQSFMVHASLGARSVSDLAGRTVCFIEGTDTQGILMSAMKARGIAIRPFDFQEQGEMDGALIGSHCTAMTAYATKLAQVRAQYRSVVKDFVLLPDRLAMAPASVATRGDDRAWDAIVAAVVDSLVEAQMLGVTHANQAEMTSSQDPVVMRLLGTDYAAGLALGLAHDWSAQVIGALGNYGEIYVRTVGLASPLQLPLGPNTDCMHGGVLCASPLK